jgi:hypothetical protein
VSEAVSTIPFLQVPAAFSSRECCCPVTGVTGLDCCTKSDHALTCCCLLPRPAPPSPPPPPPTPFFLRVGLVLLMASGREGLEDSLEYVKYVVKYRPRAPVLLLTVDPQLARACAPW